MSTDIPALAERLQAILYSNAGNYDVRLACGEAAAALKAQAAQIARLEQLVRAWKEQQK